MLLNYSVFTQTLQDIDFKANKVVNTINPHSYCIAKQDELFMTALKESDILLPDGIGIVWAEKVVNKNKINKIAGYDLFQFLMKQLDKTSGKCFFLGASQSTLDTIKDRASKEFPNIEIDAYSPPFKQEFSEEDSLLMCSKVNHFKPDVLFVGMTAPKQEKWVYVNKQRLDAQTICSIGAVFDFYAGNIKRSSPFWINLGLEWLPRFLKEPKRLAKRNLVSTPKFILEVLSCKLFKRSIL